MVPTFSPLFYIAKKMDNNSQTKSEFLDDSFMKEAEKTPVIKKRKLNKDAAPYDPSKFPINFDDIVKGELQKKQLKIQYNIKQIKYILIPKYYHTKKLKTIKLKYLNSS